MPVEFCDRVSQFLDDKYKECNRHLPHETTIIEPDELRKAGFPVFEAYHEEGEFMFTFPNGLHFGYNMDRNQAEAINFATPGWIPYGLACEHGCTESCGTLHPFIDPVNIARQHQPETYKKYIADGNKIEPKPHQLVAIKSWDEWKKHSDEYNLGLVL